MTDQAVLDSINALREDMRALASRVESSVANAQVQTQAIFQTYINEHHIAHASSSQRLWAALGILASAVGGLIAVVVSHLLNGSPTLLLEVFAPTSLSVMGIGLVIGEARFARFFGKCMGRLAATKHGRKLVFWYLGRKRK